MTAPVQNSMISMNRPGVSVPRTRAIAARANQSVGQIRDRVWKAKIRKVERIEEEEDLIWGLIAERIASDPNEERVSWEMVRRGLGLVHRER